MKLYFEDRKVQHIKFYEQPTWNFIPMSLAGKETKKLDGFFWEQLRRPRSIEDLLFRKIIQANPEEVLDAEDGK